MINDCALRIKLSAKAVLLRNAMPASGGDGLESVLLDRATLALLSTCLCNAEEV
jgi:hypothetical protein